MTDPIVLATTASVVLLGLAARADRQNGVPAGTLLATSAVGVAFLLAGLLSKESNRARLVMTLVAPAWFLASLIPSAQALHQSMLLIALLVLLPGPQRRLDTIVLLASAAGAALGLVPDAAVAATFLLTAVGDRRQQCLVREEPHIRGEAVRASRVPPKQRERRPEGCCSESHEDRPALGCGRGGGGR